jgi:hypothetical protein
MSDGLARPLRVAFAFAVLLGCGGQASGTGHASNVCDAATCAQIESSIIANGGGPATCVDPTQYYAAACEVYARCITGQYCVP